MSSQDALYTGALMKLTLFKLENFKISHFNGFYLLKENVKSGYKEEGFLVGFDAYYTSKRPVFSNFKTYAFLRTTVGFVNTTRERTIEEKNYIIENPVLSYSPRLELGTFLKSEKRFLKVGTYYEKIFVEADDFHNQDFSVQSSLIDGNSFGALVYDDYYLYKSDYFSVLANVKLDVSYLYIEGKKSSGMLFGKLVDVNFEGIDEFKSSLNTGLEFGVSEVFLRLDYSYDAILKSNIRAREGPYHMFSSGLVYKF